ncbi:MAG TPA: XRE family transcriptional regulator [Telluria sp.]|nr:XRE family transcriptional regulator [Telluria sp.]
MLATKIRQVRKDLRENQTRFWRRFGVTQSSGSRFEQGIDIPPPLAILIELYLANKVSDEDLAAVQREQVERPARPA